LAINTSVPNLPGGQGWSAGSEKKVNHPDAIQRTAWKYKGKGDRRQGKTNEDLRL
jgi:hypothetical protein